MGPQDNPNTPAPNQNMGPEDMGNQQPQPSYDSSQQGPMMVGGPQKSNKKKVWIWIIILVLVLAAAVGGWWWWKEREKKEDTNTTNTNTQQQQQQENQSACSNNFAEYENEELGLAFCYPTEWGEVTVADAKFAEADTGQRWTVKFEDKAAVNLGLVSEDWSTAVARDGTCVDPATQTLPEFSPFSTTWVTEGTPVTSATRGIEVKENAYLINEHVDNLLTNGACIEAYVITEGEPFAHATASYSAEFNAEVADPQTHIDNPNILITEDDRNDFYEFAKSIRKHPADTEGTL